MKEENNEKKQSVESAEKVTKPAVSSIEEDKGITYLAYIGLLFLVPLLAKKESEFAQFHAKQGLVLTVAWFISAFLIPVFGLGFLLDIVILVFSIMGLVNVSKGEKIALPIVGDIAEKINL